jgi:hypothetical protein
MDPGIRTPLLDLFRNENVPRDIRMVAARGAMAARQLEQVALLVLLHDDPESDVAGTARQTIESLPHRALAGFLARADVPAEIRRFFASRGVDPDPSAPAPDDDEPMTTAAAAAAEEEPEVDEKTPISTLPVISRMKLALKGTREQRSVLVRDPNRIVAAAVLSSPKLTDAEVESFARMANVSEDVLRTIGMNRTWTRNYVVIAALARNPKTPPAISLGLVGRLNERDIKGLSTDRNVPEAVRLAARKFLVKAKGH